MGEREGEPRAPALRRRLSLPLLTLYGVGTTVGAGIYVLIGRVVAEAGAFTPIAFVVAGALAAVSAFSFAELASRFPRSAGEAVYVREGLASPRLALAVGLMVAAAGVVSAAAIAIGAAGYLRHFVALPHGVLIATVVVALGAIAAWGILEAVSAAGLVTLIEVGGLVAVIAGGWQALASLPAHLAAMVPGPAAAGGILAGAILAFYAFIGFEDMVNVAEEVIAPRRTLPRAIVLTLVVTTALYFGVALVAVLAVPGAELATSEAPLALLFARTTGLPPASFAAVGVLATVNGGLIQIVMASRVLYGLAAQGALPRGLGRVGLRTGTPLVATALVTAIVLALALAFPIGRLAQTTSLITLSVFALVNAALWRLKARPGLAPAAFTVPRWLPGLGLVVSAGFVGLEIARLIAR